MRQTIIAAALLIAAAGTTGCTIDNNKHGDSDNVKIATPFGGMQVKTNNEDVLAGLGLPAYPGATVVKKDKENGKSSEGSADINMSFGSFQLKVKAVSYRTDDSPDRVLAFYKKALGRFGNVIECKGKNPVGLPVRTSEGLTCDDDDHGQSDLHASGNGIQINQAGRDHDSKFQLKAGSHKHQHLVEITPENPGTKFGLVALDLPDLNFGSSSDDDKNKDHKQ